MDCLDRVPQAALGHFDLGIGQRQVGFDLFIFTAHRLNLGLGFADAFGQGHGVQAQFAVGGRKLGLLHLKQAFGGKARAPFLCQFCCKTHLLRSRTICAQHPGRE